MTTADTQKKKFRKNKSAENMFISVLCLTLEPV